MTMDYQQSGVNIEAGNQAVDRIKPLVQQTFSKQVLSGLGSFAGFFELPSGYQEPVLVSCTDGVGTKLRLAIETGIFDTVGIDLVAMCVNDLICCGAKPLFFLDYIACHELVPDQMETLISGMVQGCKESECSLVGGEMAEMNDMYRPKDFDLAGFCVGVVEKSQVIDGSKITSGQYVYGIPSSGVHSNGFSLVRKIIEKTPSEEWNYPDLLTPTRIYVKDVLTLIEQGAPLTGIAHITGGGLVENVERILPEGKSIDFNLNDLQVPSIFSLLQSRGQVSDSEMARVFNMGIGLVLIASEPLEETSDRILIGRVS